MWLVHALTDLQQLILSEPGEGEKFLSFQEGEHPISRIRFGPPPPHKFDLSIISKFKILQQLYLENLDDLNGIYPFLFQFLNLEKLRIYGGNFLKWVLNMLSGLPILQDLYVADNHHLTGNIKSLRVLKQTLK